MSPLASLNELLKDRLLPPRPWEDDDCDWGDQEFSRQFALTGALGAGRAEREASFLREFLPESGLALDLGCGGGRTARALAQLGGRVLGMDLGPGAIEVAREKTDLPDCKFRLGDMLSDAYPEGPFDLAYCIDCGLAGLPPVHAALALANLHSALKSGATLVLEFPSLAMAESLDQRQDWYVADESPAGNFPQLVLTEDFYDREAATYTHRAYAMNIETAAVKGYSQTYALYHLEGITALMEGAGYQVESIQGEVGPGAYAEEESERLVVVGRK